MNQTPWDRLSGVRWAANKAMAVLAALVAIALGSTSCRTVTAAVPDESSPATRIVSLAPAVTETLFAIGAGPEVVGVSDYCDYPPAARRLPRVGSFLTPNLEEIVALRPSLVVATSLSSDAPEIDSLREMGYRTLVVKDGSIAGIERSIAQVGAAAGRARKARNLLRELRCRIDAIRARLKGVSRVPVLMVVGHQPMVAVGRGTFLDELLTLARARNIADGASQSWPRLSIEYIVAMKPAVILDGQMGNESAQPSGFWTRFGQIPAVRNHRVYGYPQDPILHPGPRIWRSLAILAARIHPHAFADRPREEASIEEHCSEPSGRAGATEDARHD